MKDPILTFVFILLSFVLGVASEYTIFEVFDGRARLSDLPKALYETLVCRWPLVLFISFLYYLIASYLPA